MRSIRYEHKTILDGRFHVITSPDLKGFYITADTKDEAYAEADRVLAQIDRLIPEGADAPTRKIVSA